MQHRTIYFSHPWDDIRYNYVRILCHFISKYKFYCHFRVQSDSSENITFIHSSIVHRHLSLHHGTCFLRFASQICIFSCIQTYDTPDFRYTSTLLFRPVFRIIKFDRNFRQWNILVCFQIVKTFSAMTIIQSFSFNTVNYQ